MSAPRPSPPTTIQGVLTHWRLYLEWHCLDVVSVDPPEIRLMTADETAAILTDVTRPR
jgi:hypothetical protein